MRDEITIPRPKSKKEKPPLSELPLEAMEIVQQVRRFISTVQSVEY